MCSYVMVDAGMRYASLEINQIFMRRKQLQEYQELLAKKQMKGTITRKITTYDSKFGKGSLKADQLYGQLIIFYLFFLQIVASLSLKKPAMTG